MSIMDHFGYPTRPFNLSIYTERASFLGWLSHMSERRRLTITLDPAASEPARFKNKRIQASGDMIRKESEPEVVPISPCSSTKPSSTVTQSSSTTKSSSKPHPFSLQALKMNQLARIAAREAERKGKLTLRMNTNLQLRCQKPSLREILPDPRLVKPNPTLVPMGRSLMLVANILDNLTKRRRKLQTLTLPWQVKRMTRKVIVIPLLTVKCHLLGLSSLIGLKIKIL